MESLTKTFLVQPGPDLIRSTPHTGMSLSRLGALSFLFKGKMRAQEGNVCSATYDTKGKACFQLTICGQHKGSFVLTLRL